MKRVLCALLAFLCVWSVLPAHALSVSAAAAVVICGDTGEVIFAQNAESRLPMASTTKIMTALLLCEHGELEREICVTEEMVRVEGSSMGLLPGDTVSLRALLYGMLLASGNDAANTVAIVLGGSVEGFVEMMNRRAEQLGLENTHFVTPSGLDADGHYTTALDLALLARSALQNKDFAAAAATPYETVYYGNPPYRRGLKNHNRLLESFDGAVGVKTGYTKKAGRCLVSAAKRDGKYVIAVTLNAPDDWNDHRAMLEYGLEKLQTVETRPPELSQLAVVGGTADAVALTVESLELCALDTDSISCEVFLPHFVYAPVGHGEAVGTVRYSSGETLLAELPVYSGAQTAAVNRASPGLLELFCYILSLF